mmetsp:Transcript_10685/g.29448  ORF Transcript_10685/g.29448 Transcript_10685/m.29448 type:complete len:657 (-) Transcript_10685:191-2161(-)
MNFIGFTNLHAQAMFPLELSGKHGFVFIVMVATETTTDVELLPFTFTTSQSAIRLGSITIGTFSILVKFTNIVVLGSQVPVNIDRAHFLLEVWVCLGFEISNRERSFEPLCNIGTRLRTWALSVNAINVGPLRIGTLAHVGGVCFENSFNVIRDVIGHIGFHRFVRLGDDHLFVIIILNGKSNGGTQQTKGAEAKESGKEHELSFMANMFLFGLSDSFVELLVQVLLLWFSIFSFVSLNDLFTLDIWHGTNVNHESAKFFKVNFAVVVDIKSSEQSFEVAGIHTLAHKVTKLFLLDHTVFVFVQLLEFLLQSFRGNFFEGTAEFNGLSNTTSKLVLVSISLTRDNTVVDVDGDNGQQHDTNNDEHGNEATLHLGVIIVGAVGHRWVAGGSIVGFSGAAVDNVVQTVAALNNVYETSLDNVDSGLRISEFLYKFVGRHLLQVKVVSFLHVEASRGIRNSRRRGDREGSLADKTGFVRVLELQRLGLGEILASNLGRDSVIGHTDGSSFSSLGVIVARQDTGSRKDISDTIFLPVGSSVLGTRGDVSIVSANARRDGVLHRIVRGIDGAERIRSDVVDVVHMLVETGLGNRQVHEELDVLFVVRVVLHVGVLHPKLGLRRSTVGVKSAHGAGPVAFHLVPKVVVGLEIGGLERVRFLI